ncbi:uncharacterized protein BDZ99DRAFT_566086 [Mytilinidion resinicola]|uniref:SUN domain-containing protein n=1 Tax=Mytilinidion resinicola TaxID=574789 RepID=A0A6A6Z7Q6_9PEZI|nr:uncharacterized protein BDZ99DRAFT_566086 [Mytilinidion resinicola]KAF2816237.1 hypothetical protein BDZ99DRAFT_566086 [Mytilinidion resinicola]
MASNTPYRRSSRLASATPAPARSGAGSAAGSVNQSIAGSRATPGRTTGKRAGPLPKVAVNRSHAYGSAGHAHRADDIAPPTTAFDQAFAAQRESALERDVTVARLSSSSRSPQRSPIESRPSQIREPSPVQSELATPFEPTSLIDSSKSFGANHEAGLHAEASVRNLNGNIHARHSPAASDTTSRGGGHPSLLRVLLRMIKRNWLDVLKAFVMMVGFVFFISIFYRAVTSLSVSTEPITDAGDAMKSQFTSTWDYVKNGVPFSTSGSSDLYPRVVKLENSVQDIQEHLPEHIVVQVDQVTGEPVISDAFWRALRSKFSQKGLFNVADKDREWKNFLVNNAKKIENAINNDRKKLLTHFDNTFILARKQHQVLTRDEFAELMQKDYLAMSARVEKEVERVAKQIGTVAIRQQIRLESLAYANLLANSELSLKTVNFFSPGLGAKIIPRLTSPTLTRDVSWKAIAFKFLLWAPPRHAPITALERWEEASDCWCTAASSTKQSQLAVNMAIPIFPTRVTIENIPKEGTLNWKSAPKDVELWVEIDDPDRREAVEISFNELHKPCQGSGPGSKYVCIGTMMYDIHGPNHVQTFDLELDLKAHDVQVERAIVRVIETWGSDYTCLYRIRMHGEHLE